MSFILLFGGGGGSGVVTPTSVPYDNVDLLARLRFLLRRPTADESLTDPQAYQLLTDAQQALYEDVLVRVPGAMISAPVAMTTTDNKVFSYGLDVNGWALAPFGKVGIYPTLSCVPDSPWQEGLDYYSEGAQIRIPNNGTYSGTLYYYGSIPPAPISATSQPSLIPAPNRVLCVYWAAAEYASLGNLRADDAQTYRAKYTEGLGRLLLKLKTQYKKGPAFGRLSRYFSDFDS